MTAKTIIPAYPGFRLIRCNGGDAWIDAPIIAWLIDDDVPWPVTDEEAMAPDSQAWAILRPDGDVVEPLESNWKTFAKFKAARAQAWKPKDEPKAQ